MNVSLRSGFFRFWFVLVALAFAGVGRAEDLSAVKARMVQRLEKLDAAKGSGAVGENNRGLVESRAGGSDTATLIADENHDRETVYAALAASAKTSADEVGKARARQIAQSSRPGVWIQEPTGEWKKK